MGSDEERLEEMLKAVMETENEKKSVPAPEQPKMAAEGFSEMPTEELPGLPEAEAGEQPDVLATDFPEESEQPMEEQSDVSAADFPEESEQLMEEQPDVSAADFPEESEQLMEEQPDVSATDFPEMSEQPMEELPDVLAADFPEMSERSMDELPEMSMDELPDVPMEDFSELSMEELPEIPMEDFSELSEMPMEDFSELPEMSMEDFSELPEMSAEDFSEMPTDELPEMPAEDFSNEPSNEMAASGIEDPEGGSAGDEQRSAASESQESFKDEMAVDPLKLLAMSEEEIDKVLEEEAALGEKFSGRRGISEASDQTSDNDDLADIEKLLQMSDNHEQVAGGEKIQPGDSVDSTDLDNEDVQRLLGLASGTEKRAAEELKTESADEKKKGKKKEKKKKEKKKKDNGEKKEGFGKKLATLFFGSDDELEEEEAVSAEEGQKNEGAGAKKGAGAKEKKKKEKKKKEPKKKEADPQKAAKEKQKKEKNAEKAKKKAEKAEQAEKEKRAAKKLPKKKVIVWVIFCASIGVGILLLNSVGMATVELADARNAFDEKDFETAYRLLNGRELSEEDQLIFSQSSAILHLQHVEEVYGNHLKLEKPVNALNDLLTGVAKYQEILQAGRTELITPELTAEYQNIVGILQENYSLSEAGAMEINALESDYEYSLQLEALVNGELYQSQAEVEQQQEEETVNLPDLEDMLPEEEEYFNDSSD